MLHLSTHVLDTTAGKPAAGIRVALGWQALSDSFHDQPMQMANDLDGSGPHDANWQQLSIQATDADGRIADWHVSTPLQPGWYRLRFEIGPYWQGQGFYPYADLVFALDERRPRLHVPLLISPYGLTSYRGS